MNLVKRNHRNAFPFVMDELFRDFLGGTQYVQHKGTAPVNIKETESAFLLELAAPGLKKEDFNIEIDKDVLTISSETKKENIEKEEGKFTRREFVHTSFRRAFTLPENVKAEDINAAYEHGVLRVSLPKKEAELPKEKRVIDIS